VINAHAKRCERRRRDDHTLASRACSVRLARKPWRPVRQLLVRPDRAVAGGSAVLKVKVSRRPATRKAHLVASAIWDDFVARESRLSSFRSAKIVVKKPRAALSLNQAATRAKDYLICRKGNFFRADPVLSTARAAIGETTFTIHRSTMPENGAHKLSLEPQTRQYTA
jgi:hypothetical protein